MVGYLLRLVSKLWHLLRLRLFLLIALGAFISYIARLWNLFKDLIIQFKSLGFSASGFSYGISNSQLVSSFWGFVHASGLDDAFITSGTLFISLLSAYFGIQAYKLFYTLFKDGFTMVSNGTKLLPKKMMLLLLLRKKKKFNEKKRFNF